MELSNTIKQKNDELTQKCSQLELLQQEHAALEKEVSSLKEHIKEQEESTAAIVRELDSVRGLINTAESECRRLENENQDLYARFLTEKQQMASELNEMNNVVDGMKGFVGGGVSFLRSLKSTVMPGTRHDSSGKSAAEGDEDFEIIGSDEKTADRRSISAALSVSMDGVPLGMLPSKEPVTEIKPPLPEEERTNIHSVITNYGPPRTPQWVEKCHATEINDVFIDSHYAITAGADSKVKVYDLSSREVVHTFMSTGPSLSVDAIEEEWVISACAAGRSECRIWSLKTGRQRVNFGGHSNKILCTRFVGKPLL